MPGTAVTDAHTGWTCENGASLILEGMTPGSGKLGTLHAVIYACPDHQEAAENRLAAVNWSPKVRPAPSSHRWNPWPCGHITSYGAAVSGFGSRH